MLTSLAIAAFTDILSQKNVIVDAERIYEIAGTTFHVNHQIFAILTPENKTEVISCVALANQLQIAIYPSSTSLNWGYGLVTCDQRAGVILDLHKLNKIVDYNEELAYVVIEPGVTFGQLAEFLVRNDSNLMVSATGSAPETSIIGNTLEKGIGKGSCGERSQHVCGLEVVLPTGECIQTSFGRFHESAVTHVKRAGLGPDLDGLFLQSSLGIVTQMTLWLKPIPAYLQVVSFSLNHEDKLSPLLNQLQHIALHGYAETGYTVFNDYKMLMSATQYPWHETEGVTPLPSPVKESLKKNLDIPLWNGHLQIQSANAEIGELQRAVLLTYLEEYVDDVTCITSDIAQSKALLTRYFTGNNAMHPKEMLLLRHLGISCGRNIRSVYWRKKSLPPANLHPANDECGLLWVCPVIPFTADHIQQALQIIYPIILKFSFEPALSISVVSGRSVVLVISIVFDNSEDDEAHKANQCKDVLFAALATQGYYPYRVPANAMHLTKGGNQSYAELMGKIKKTLDPNNVLSPGRYTS